MAGAQTSAEEAAAAATLPATDAGADGADGADGSESVHGAGGVDTERSAGIGSSADTEAGVDAESSTGGQGRARRISNPVLAAAIALVVIAAGCAAWSGVAWYRTAHDRSLQFSRTRDEVLRSGEQAVQNLNTLDYRNVGQGLNTWLDSTTGDLRSQILQGRTQFEQQVQQAKTISSARILDGAVTELDERSGKARVIVAVQITVTPPQGQPATKPSRLQGELTRTASGWKLSALGQEPVGTGAGTSGTGATPGQ